MEPALINKAEDDLVQQATGMVEEVRALTIGEDRYVRHRVVWEVLSIVWARSIPLHGRHFHSFVWETLLPFVCGEAAVVYRGAASIILYMSYSISCMCFGGWLSLGSTS